MERKSLFLFAFLILASNIFAASFRGLGDLPGGSFYSRVHDVSADGSVVVGSSSSGNGYEAFRWTSETGMQGLGDLPGRDFYSVAQGISGDGSVIVGYGHSSSGYSEAFRWTVSEGMVSLGDLSGGGFFSGAMAASYDGSVIVGYGHSDLCTGGESIEAFYWTASGGMVGIGDLPGGRFGSAGYSVSYDGSVIVGYGVTSSHWTSFRWTSSEGMTGYSFGYMANDVSADGTVMVGDSTSGEAFRWTEDEGIQMLGKWAPNYLRTSASTVSGDGCVVAGYGFLAEYTAYSHDVFYWTIEDGFRSLKDILLNDYGLNLGGWILQDATGLSYDGSTIVGWGINPQGQDEAWIATIPEPGTVSLIGIGTILIRSKLTARLFGRF
ncbi:MAG: hypothetical protein A2Y10_06230 [Planctomycetes bacterium GWF2_41_51]|nr:MAG: hypothetical protein A2Y10_06230 [Planctomycetes bacterium GWF2_41_51]